MVVAWHDSQQYSKHCMSGVHLLSMLMVVCGVVMSGKQQNKPVMICVLN
jgi:hypothetical protein